MFVVTKAGVIATDPIGLRRPQAVTTYIDEMKKVTNQPVKYVVYSHGHYDHIAGCKPFKDLGARFIAHKNARAQLRKVPSPDVVMPDEVVDGKRTLSLGGTTLELIYVGRNHSDNSLVMRLPKEKLIFTVDFIPIQSLLFRNLPDTASRLEWEESLKRVLALDWERMIPGPYAGTKQDARLDRLHAGPRRRGDESRRRRQVHRHRDEGGEASQVREMGQLRHVPAHERGALLLLEQRLLRTRVRRRGARPRLAPPALLRSHSPSRLRWGRRLNDW